MSYEINPFTSIVSLIACFFLLFLLMKKNKTNKTKLPPGPRKLPLIGNLHQIGKPPHRSLRNLSKEHGDLMFLQLGFAPTLVVSSADKARDIFKHHDLVFSGRPPLYGFKKISYDFSSVTIAPYGEYWREIRKIVVLELMTAKRIQSFGNIRVQELASMLDRIATICRSNRLPLDLSSLVFSLSNNVVCRVAFGASGVDGGRKRSEFQGILHELQGLAGEVNLADYFPGIDWINRLNGVDRKLDKVFRDLDGFFDKIIEEHLDPMRPESDVEDLIDVLIRIQNDPCQTITLTNKHIKAVLIDVFVAGTETSSTTIVWAMAELMRNPSAKRKATQEVREVAKGKAQVEETDLPKLAYLKHVIKESLRLHPPIPLIARETTESCTIDSKYQIAAKTRVLFNVAAISTDPIYWKDPEEFRPERFVNSKVDFKGQHFELFSFGAGRRGCPGINFATPLLELTLANLLFRFDWKLPEGMSTEDLDMEEAPGATVGKKAPLCLVASPQ